MHRRKHLVFRSLTLVLPGIMFLIAGASAQDLYEPELVKAEQVYYEGFFDEVIDLVNARINKGSLTTAEQAWAYKLLGQAYVSKNELQSARIYVQKLLEVAPDYEPNQDRDLDTWQELVEEAKQERERLNQQQQPPMPLDNLPAAPVDSTKKSGSKKWVWLGGGGSLITAGIVYAIVSHKEPKASKQQTGFPDPPARP